MRDVDTVGRRFPEKRHPYRTDYQRDRDRIIHTKAFRRLEKKTQVFGSDFSDHFRNRLTHTIEVSQISRTISQSLGLNTDLCEVLALCHDIGHPPYSHHGERVLDRIMKSHGSGFEHNLHALRIVEDFEEKYVCFRGLNLTFEVREGIVKHSRDYQDQEIPYIDISEYMLAERPPLEAQLIDLADEIAYNTADLDDGYDSGFLTLEQLHGNLMLFREVFDQVEKDHPHAHEKLMVSESVRAIIDILVTALIKKTARTLADHQIESVIGVREFPGRMVGFDSETDEKNLELKRFLHTHLYNHEILKVAMKRAETELEELFDYYLVEPAMLPESHRSRIESIGLHQVVCDYIAGMTDSFARAKHERISGPPSLVNR
jgi:dGTPase